MEDPFLLRKFVSPTIPQGILHREPLVNYLQEAIAGKSQQDEVVTPYKLVLLCAPAGYGKTTLLADFASATSIHCCWYFLDETDMDYVVFLRRLFASIHHTFPDLSPAVSASLAHLSLRETLAPAAVYQPILDTLCKTLAHALSSPLALLLGNYEEINDSEILTALVDYLLKKLPPQMTIVIESRVVPNISFAALFARNEMCGLNSDTLRFSAQEITELARLQGLTTLTPEQAEELTTAFDGWIAGILLGTRLGEQRLAPFSHIPPDRQGSSLRQVRSLATQRRSQLFRYIVDEIFKREKQAYTFLQEASLLQHMDPDICNCILGRSDSAEQLAHLEQAGLFVISHENPPHILYMCHPVLRDLFREQLAQLVPDRFLALHRQAAELFLTTQDYEQAMYHALTGALPDLQIQILISCYHQLLRQGQHETLTRWLGALAPSTLEHSPHLLLIQATMILLSGQHELALQLLTKASALLARPGEQESSQEMLLLHAEIILLQSKALFRRGDYIESQLLCQNILTSLPEDQMALRATALMRLGVCANLQGDFTTGLAYLQQALHLWDHHPPAHQAIEIHGALANTYDRIGNAALANHHITEALYFCEQLYDQHGMVENLNRKGSLHLSQGAYGEAETALLKALHLSRQLLFPRGEAYALANLGSLYLEQGHYAQALKYSQDGLPLTRQWANQSLVTFTLSNLALIHLLMGDPENALLFLNKISLPYTGRETIGYEQAERELTYALILIYQRRYEEAYACLKERESAFSTPGLKREWLLMKLRLAACALALQRQKEALHLLEEVAQLLTASKTMLHYMHAELQRLPQILQAIQTFPQLTSLRAIVGLAHEEEKAAQPTPLVIQEGVTPPTLKILAFGDATVLIDEQPIKRWRIARAMELLFFLLHADRPMSKEHVITALWSEYDEQANQAFHLTIHYLRKVLGSTAVIFRENMYHLDLGTCFGENVWYDVQVFHGQQTQAKQALAEGDEVEARKAFQNMIALYRGDYGQSFYSDWCMARRDELRMSFLEACRQLAQFAWKEEAFDESLNHWRKILSVDSCSEDAHYGVMRCYLRQGKRSAALRQYQRCKEILDQELGVQPGASLHNFYLRLTGASGAPLPAK